MRRICGIFGLLCALLLQGCMVGNRYTYGYYTGRVRPTVANPPAIPSHRSDFHIVQRGETLYSIAFSYGEDVRTVARWNHISSPYTIYPNQRLRLTPPPTVYPAPIRHHWVASKSHQLQLQTKNHKENANTAYAIHDLKQKISWQWPANGKIISMYSATQVGKKGIDIAGRIGQPIYAAARGIVVYCGDGLRGYGRLIIIKHNDTYFTAYAHNSRLLVKDDQKVNKGQHIADMGSTEADRPMLHFEVRRDGKPVDPLRYLPRRH